MLSLKTPRLAYSAIADLIATRAYRRLRLARRLTQYCRDGLAARESVVTVSSQHDRDVKRHFVAINRVCNSIQVSCHEWMILRHQDEIYFRLCPVLALVVGTPCRALHTIADISDGEESGPGLLSFCSRDPQAILIPDHLFVCSWGYRTHRQLAHANQTEWNARSGRVVWRGSTTGVGTISKENLVADDPDLLLRVRLCLQLKGVDGTDVKISSVTQSSKAPQDRDRLARVGILGDFISPIAWHAFKFAIDIDGNSNAWSNLFTRLIMGCCVLKVASPLGYRQWYYSDLEAWTHYVPVKADLSDLREQIAWCRANLDDCARIAAKGRAFAMARTYESEIAYGIRRLCEASIFS